MSKLPDMRLDFAAAIHEAGVEPTDFALVGPYKYEEILNLILERFTRHGRKNKSAYWLWENFKGKRYSIDYVSPTQLSSVLASLVAPEERVWLVAENRGSEKSQGNFWLYEGTMRATLKVLDEMFRFEFYLVSKQLEWLLCFMHEEVLIGVGQTIIDRMKKVRIPT